jgi:hypothetical protein
LYCPKIETGHFQHSFTQGVVVIPDLARLIARKGEAMETQTPESEDSKSKPIKKTRSKSTNKSKSCLKKISADSAKALSLISEKANKKDFGRRVKDSEIISMALTLMTDKRDQASSGGHIFRERSPAYGAL